MIKKSACNVGDLGSIPGLGRYPGGGHGNPLQYSCLENPHGQGCLVGYGPWGWEELDMTEWLSAHTSEIHSFLEWTTGSKCQFGQLKCYIPLVVFFANQELWFLKWKGKKNILKKRQLCVKKKCTWNPVPTNLSVLSSTGCHL